MSTSSRRDFVKKTVVAGTSAFSLVPRRVLGGPGQVPPSEKVNLALIGIGGRGAHVAMLADWWEVDREERDLDIPEHEALSGKWNEATKYERRIKESMVNIVAMCDVDAVRSAPTLNPNNKIYPPGDRFLKARMFKDYRLMLDQVKGDIDGVLIAVPDHTHFHATLSAMQLGLHVYTEKPLTRFASEARRLTEAARKYEKVVTQMGNQGHSSWSTARIRDWVLNGSIGQVSEVVAWNPGNAHALDPRIESPVPETLNYDLWVNREPFRPYQAGAWRPWSYWSSGTLGDFGCHTLDAAFYALDLRYPERVEVETGGEWPVPDSFPSEQTVAWYVPARDGKPPVRVRYFMMGAAALDKRVVPLLEHLPPGTSLKDLFRFGRGAAIIGEKATILYGGWGATSRIVPDDKAKEIGFAPEKSPRVDGHMRTFLRACKGQGKTLSSFDYAGPLAEMVALGDVALRSKDKMINWDFKAMKVTNDAQANQLAQGSPPRPGWEI
jgi:predicted dehydrogenase